MSFTASLKDIVCENHNGLLGAKEHWPRRKLKDVVTILNGFPYESSRFSGVGGEDGSSTPLMRIRDIVRGYTDTFYQGEVDPTYLVKRGELVVGMDGDFNSALWAGEPALLNQRVCKLTPDESVLRRKFLAYILPGYLSAINDATPSVTVKHLSSRTVGDIPLPLPSLEEQDEVIDLLDTEFSRLEAGVSALKRGQANLKRYRAAVLKAACEGRLVPTEAGVSGETPFESGPVLRERILSDRRASAIKKNRKEPQAVDRELPRLPSGWGWATLDELGQENRPIIYGIIKPGPHDPDGVPYVRVTEMKDGRIDLDSLRKASPARAAKFARATLAAGDLLISKDGTIGRVAVVPPELAGGNITQHVMRAPIHQFVNRDYVVWAVRSEQCQLWLKGETKGVALQGVNVEDFRRLPVPLPPLAEQERIVAEVERRLSVVDELEATITANLRRATRLRQSVLQSAFSSS